MDELTHARMSRQVALNEVAQEEKYLERADGPAYGQSKERIASLYRTVSELDCKISALTEASLFQRDSEAAINRAVQISQIKLIQSLLANCFAGADNETGMTSTRFTTISNELYRALKELEA